MAVRAYFEIDVYDGNGNVKTGSDDTLRLMSKEIAYDNNRYVEISDPKGNVTIMRLDDLHDVVTNLRRMNSG